MEYLTFKQYQIKTRRSVQEYLTLTEKRYQNCIGVIGETTEVIDLLLGNEEVIKKNKIEIVKEIGDVLWYFTRMVDDYDLSLERIAHCEDMISFSLSLHGYCEYLDEIKKFGLETVMKSLSKRLIKHVGKLTDDLKKTFFQGHELDLTLVTHEGGEILETLTMIALLFNYTLEDVALLQLEKSKKRYPKGFSVKESIERKDLES